MSKTILFISDHGDPLATLGGEQAGGQNNYVKQLALALEKRGHSIDVFTHWADHNAPQIETFGTRCRVIRIAGGHKGFVAKADMYHMLPVFLKEMEQLQDLSQYDVMHTHYWLSGLLGAEVSKRHRIPWVHTSHSLAVAKQKATGVRELKRFKAEQMILQACDTVVATSQTERALIKATVKNPAPIRIIPIGVDAAFTPENTTTPAAPTFMYAGRLEETKGIFTMLQAFKLLSYNGLLPARTKLCIIGGEQTQVDSSTKQALCPKLKSAVSGIENRVEFLGALPQRELAQQFKDASAVIVPSFYESFGMVAAEAQACGTPVIASKVGGLGDIVLDKKTGLHVAVGDARELASAIALLAKRPDIAKRLGQEAATFAQQNFNWTTIAKKVDRLYEGVSRENQHTYVSN